MLDQTSGYRTENNPKFPWEQCQGKKDTGGVRWYYVCILHRKGAFSLDAACTRLEYSCESRNRWKCQCARQASYEERQGKKNRRTQQKRCNCVLYISVSFSLKIYYSKERYSTVDSTASRRNHDKRRRNLDELADLVSRIFGHLVLSMRLVIIREATNLYSFYP